MIYVNQDYTWRTIKQDTLGWFNTKVDKSLWVKQGSLHHLSQFINLLLTSSDIGVGHIRLLFNLLI